MPSCCGLFSTTKSYAIQHGIKPTVNGNVNNRNKARKIEENGQEKITNEVPVVIPVPDSKPEEPITEEPKSEESRQSDAKSIDEDIPVIPEGLERRPGVIPLPTTNFDEDQEEEIPKYPKDQDDIKLITEAIQKNEFLNKILQDSLLKDVVDAMSKKQIKAKDVLIKEGDKGSEMYVSSKGRYEVSVKGKGILSSFEDNRVFGELAILYNDKRAATIKATKSGEVWVLDRTIYQKLMLRSNIKRQDQQLQFLEKVPKLNKVGREVLQKVATLLKTEFFPTGHKIVVEGDVGDKFYIISAGSVSIFKEGEGEKGKRVRGEYFGELALLKEDNRQATVTAEAPGTECLTLERQQFIDHFGELGEEGLSSVEETTKISLRDAQSEYDNIKLTDFKIIATLGVGGFGRVELVQHKENDDLIFALKYLKKIDMVEQNQQEHVYNERMIQMKCNSQFIIRLYRSYKDKRYVYFLMESCLGGDLWTLLQRQKNRKFDEKDARFIAACVLEAFSYLHDRGIVYRDLKPENLLIDEQGYVKLTDFGFAKKLGSRGRTFTFAGTPEYVAPEVILNRGHDKAVDYWAFGIFIFELLTGRTPFRTNDSSHMRTYNKILTGIDSVEFPSYVNHKARHIIEKLCKAIPTERLGCQRHGVKDIRNHKWFLGFDWAKLSDRKMPAPFKPRLKSKTDTRYFEAFKKDYDIPPEETSGWDKDF